MSAVSPEEFAAIKSRVANVVARPAIDGRYYNDQAQCVHDRAVLFVEVLRLREMLHNLKKVIELHDDCPPDEFCTIMDELKEVIR